LLPLAVELERWAVQAVAVLLALHRSAPPQFSLPPAARAAQGTTVEVRVRPEMRQAVLRLAKGRAVLQGPGQVSPAEAVEVVLILRLASVARAELAESVCLPRRRLQQHRWVLRGLLGWATAQVVAVAARATTTALACRRKVVPAGLA
jgi:hypothetical protein